VTRELGMIAVVGLGAMGAGPAEVLICELPARSGPSVFVAPVREAGFAAASSPGILVTAGRPSCRAEPGFRDHPAR
jgi:hypothetical protein